jgi:hypothetical protein
MLGRSKTKNSSRQGPEDHINEPLLGDDEREVVFSLDDDDEDESSIGREGSSGGRDTGGGDAGIRSYAPPLRSTMQSREAGASCSAFLFI